MSETVRFPVIGMTCPSCVGHISGAVRRVGGVESVKVDLRSEAATIRFDPKRTSLGSIGEAIARAGYAAAIDKVQIVGDADQRRGWLARLGLRHKRAEVTDSTGSATRPGAP